MGGRRRIIFKWCRTSEDRQKSYPVEHDRSCLRMDQEEGILEDVLDSSRHKLAVHARGRMKLP